MDNVKKKVLFFLPGGVGGAERMTITVARMLPVDRFDVRFVVIGTQRDIYSFLPEGYPVECIPVHNKYCFSTLRILWKIRQVSPHLVYCSQSAYNPRVIIASRLAGVRVIVRSSGMPGTYSRSNFRDVKATYRHADFVIAQQEEMRQEIISLLGVEPNRTAVLHNPLDLTAINTKANAPSPYPDFSSVNFCHVGRVERDKGADIAISAFALIRQKLQNAHLYFVGKYDEKSVFYRQLISLIEQGNLQDYVHFEGFDSNPYRWMKHCDCFVFPSRREGLPNALIEASYLQRPCVAARCLAIIDDIIQEGENGYIVPVGDIDALAEAMLKAIELKECRMQYKPSSSDDFIRIFDSLLQ